MAERKLKKKWLDKKRKNDKKFQIKKKKNLKVKENYVYNKKNKSMMLYLVDFSN